MLKNLHVSKEAMQKCIDCSLVKICRVPHQTRTTTNASSKYAVLHIDTASPIKPTSFDGAKYFILAIKEYSSYLKI